MNRRNCRSIYLSIIRETVVIHIYGRWKAQSDLYGVGNTDFSLLQLLLLPIAIDVEQGNWSPRSWGTFVIFFLGMMHVSDHQKKKSITGEGKRPPIWIYPKPEGRSFWRWQDSSVLTLENWGIAKIFGSGLEMTFAPGKKSSLSS